MVKASLFVLAADASLYSYDRDLHCYAGHGGVPLDDADTPWFNMTVDDCQDRCDNTSSCSGFTMKSSGSWHATSGDCYLRSELVLADCEVIRRSGWGTYSQVQMPPLTGNILYHLFEPKYTGLASKDAGDFKGDASFIFNTFARFSAGNPEASMEHNILEMSEVNVTGWGDYEECNAPGANGMFVCPNTSTTYCCTTHDPTNRSHNIPANHTTTQLPGIEMAKMSLGRDFGSSGFWYSFPLESQNTTWTEKLLRRISGKCLGDAWRKDAGGCDECGDELDSCVADCIKTKLAVNGSTELLKVTWDRVFSDPDECPDVPLPSEAEPFTDGLPQLVLV